ncbi:MAG: rubredoxin [Clostridia bacterium]|nr:rubredoxin [Clostridia bacterium]
MRYICGLCGYIYDEANGDSAEGIAPGTVWMNVPDEYACPLCGAGKEAFEAE